MPAYDDLAAAGRISALAGLLAGIAAIAVGSIFLIFALPSIGRPGEFDYLFSQAAGGFLIILLGMLGLFASALAWPSPRGERAASVLGGLFYAAVFLLFAAYQEWKAAALVLMMAGIAWLALRRRGDAARMLFLLAGLFGFALTQAAITLLPYGWKAWSVSGVLFLFAFLLLSFSPHLIRLPLLTIGRNRRRGILLYSLLALALIALSMASLVHLPGPAGPGSFGVPVQSQYSVGISSAGNDCGCQAGLDNYSISALPQNESMGIIQEDRGRQRPGDGDGSEKSCNGAAILTPEDVRTFQRGETVQFSARSCPREPCRYLWHSSRDSYLGTGQHLERNNLSLGWHNITLSVSDSGSRSEDAYVNIAIAEPWVCGKVDPRPRYYPPDTPCRDIWPNGTEECQQVEVCHPHLDYIVAEAVDCCDGSPLPGKACADACNRSGGDRKKCRGIYLINSFGPDARYMKGYALFKACCSGYPECTRMCGSWVSGKRLFTDGYNDNVSNLSCRPQERGLEAWHSDSNMSQNSASMGLLPAHASINILQTGVCSDYSAALTTMLRKAGYNQSEAFMTASYAFDLPLVGDHPGHAFNLVLLPGDDKYHMVDTTGNGDGINLEGVPGYFRFTGCFLGMPSHTRIMDWWMGYCKMISKHCSNDAGYFKTPDKDKIWGCTEKAKFNKMI